MNWKSLLLSTTLSLALGACGSSPGSGAGGDAGGAGGGDAGTSDEHKGLSINAALGLTVNAFPIYMETAISGEVLVELDGKEAPSDSAITINGKALRPVDILPGFFEANPADAPAVGGDRKLTIAASVSGQSTSITLECPEELEIITSPSAGTPLAPGDSVTASWSREIFLNNLGGFYVPLLTMKGYDASSKRTSFDKSSADLEKGTRSGTVTAPETDESGYLLSLQFPGVFKAEGNNAGICYRSNRVVFPKK